MVKLYKIKFIKDTELKKTGEIGEATKKNAEAFVNSGYAEYFKNNSADSLAEEDKPLILVMGDMYNNLRNEYKFLPFDLRGENCSTEEILLNRVGDLNDRTNI